MEEMLRYFPELDDLAQARLFDLNNLYNYWNDRVNLISRRDIEHLYTRHVLHSLAIHAFIKFKPDAEVLDVGTGGGFPGIPLAIANPYAKFHLVDSIGKKITVCNRIVESLKLKNVTTQQIRAEKIKEKYDFIVSRAVTAFPKFVSWTRNNIKKEHQHPIPNGIIYLKGGDLKEELKPFENKAEIIPLNKFFNEDFFETKKIVYLPI